MAKSALNQQTVTFAREFQKEGKNISVVCMEPGFLPTRLTEWDSADDMGACIEGIMDVIDSLSIDDRGHFIEWSGKRLRL